MSSTPAQPLDAIRRAWRSAFGSRKVAYLSGPITTGPRFIDWWAETGHALAAGSDEFAAGLRQHVILPNERDLQATAEILRGRSPEAVIEPASVFVTDWSQQDYLILWEEFITDHASRILLMDGWQFSAGCATEFCRAHLEGVPTALVDGTPVVARDGIDDIARAIASVEQLPERPDALLRALTGAHEQLRETIPTIVFVPGGGMPRKDASLDRLADIINVAQFVSFEPERGRPRQAFARVLGDAPNSRYADVAEAARTLLARSADKSVNVRSFTPESPLSREFIYGLRSVDDVVGAVRRLTLEGLNTIVNETVDIHDGGVSGVLLGNMVEFAPDDTPRAVEKAGTASLPRGWGTRLLASVYGFEPDLAVPEKTRLEFSLHPRPRGWRYTHTLGWEIAEHGGLDLPPVVQWPNRFSKMIGDKVFGLLVAHHIGLPVPRTTVINRRVAPFSFGQDTGSSEFWCRTAPFEQMPGKFTTTRGWSDPFQIMATEDPHHDLISSIIGQASVEPRFSGASIVLRSGEIKVEGRHGAGDLFMLGTAIAERLPDNILADVEDLHAAAAELGPVRFEWVHDGERAWVVQMHRGATRSGADTLVPGDAARWIGFDVSEGLEALRSFLAGLEANDGVELVGEVGFTSHIADVIRKANVPARMKTPATSEA